MQIVSSTERCSWLLMFSTWLALGCTAGGIAGCGAEPPVLTAQVPGDRKVVATRWDTVFIVGNREKSQDLLEGPNMILARSDVVFIADDMMGKIVAIDATTGAFLWEAGGVGSGPEEFRGIADIQTGPDGDVWALDYGNGRISRWSPSGQFLGVRTIHHLPAPPTSILVLRDEVIAMSQNAPHPFMELDPVTLQLRRSFDLSWPEPIPEAANRRVTLAAVTDSSWMAAFVLGPGFLLWDRKGAHAFRYRERIPFAFRSSPRIRALRADSARFGAVSLATVEGNVFMLFGGRPVKRAHPGEPTVWVDVYGSDGYYLHSYHLPVDADAMSVVGDTFYLLHTDLYPTVIALRPQSG